MFVWVAVATDVTENVPLLLPAGMTTLAGTVISDGVSVASVTVAPPAGAARVSVTVPVADVPPSNSAGLIATAATAGGPRLTTQSLAELENSFWTLYVTPSLPTTV